MISDVVGVVHVRPKSNNNVELTVSRLLRQLTSPNELVSHGDVMMLLARRVDTHQMTLAGWRHLVADIAQPLCTLQTAATMSVDLFTGGVEWQR